MSGYLRPKSNLRFLKPPQLTQLKKAEKKEIAGSQNEELLFAIKDLEGKVKRSEERNTRKERECQALEDELVIVLTEAINRKKEVDLLKAQLRMQQCYSQCKMFPLIANEKCPLEMCTITNLESVTIQPLAEVSELGACGGTNSPDNLTEKEEAIPSLDKEQAAISTTSLNLENQDLNDQRAPLERLPVSEGKFNNWDKLLKDPKTFASMKSLYLSINLNDMKKFLKKCILKTFEECFIQKISFEVGSQFNDSNVLSCLIEAVQEKFKDKRFDDTAARKEIIAAFRRFRDAKSKKIK